jgi:hypothetical protein
MQAKLLAAKLLAEMQLKTLTCLIVSIRKMGTEQ